MKRIFCVLVLISVLFSSACGKEERKEEIIVFAASSLTDTLYEIAYEYEKENPDTKIIFNFDSSGTLKSQIEEETNEQIKKSYVLASGILNPTETKTYELRMWVSEDSTNEVMKKTFKSIVYMEAKATENHL